jgi:hypothetical protein
MNIKVVAVDLAKYYFQVCVLTDENRKQDPFQYKSD